MQYIYIIKFTSEYSQVIIFKIFNLITIISAFDFTKNCDANEIKT